MFTLFNTKATGALVREIVNELERIAFSLTDGKFGFFNSNFINFNTIR